MGLKDMELNLNEDDKLEYSFTYTTARKIKYKEGRFPKRNVFIAWIVSGIYR